MKLVKLTLFLCAVSISLHTTTASAGLFDDVLKNLEGMSPEGDGSPTNQRVRGLRQHAHDVLGWIGTLDDIAKAQAEFTSRIQSLQVEQISSLPFEASPESTKQIVEEFETSWRNLMNDNTPIARTMGLSKYGMLLNRLSQQNSVNAINLIDFVAKSEIASGNREMIIKLFQAYSESIRRERAELFGILTRDLAQISLANE